MFSNLNNGISVVLNPEKVLYALPLPAALLTPEGKILYANELYAKCWQSTVASILNKTIDMLSPSTYEAFLKNVELLRQNKTVEPYEYAQFGRYYMVSLKGNFNSQEELISVLVCGSDITNVKNKEDGLKKQNSELKRLAEYDHLTGLMNRRAYDFNYEQCCNAFRSGKLEKFSIIVMDIDDFKKVNDQYGHAMGDEVLCHIARMLEHIQSDEMWGQSYRYGGEEFVILLPNCSLKDACNLAEDIRQSIEKLSSSLFVQYGMKVSISCGVASSENIPIYSDHFEYADKAMYYAKQNQKNCVYYFDETEFIGLNLTRSNKHAERNYLGKIDEIH